MRKNVSHTAHDSAGADIAASLASYARYLRAANLAPSPLKTYHEAVRTLATFLTEQALPTDVTRISARRGLHH